MGVVRGQIRWVGAVRGLTAAVGPDGGRGTSGKMVGVGILGWGYWGWGYWGGGVGYQT